MKKIISTITSIPFVAAGVKESDYSPGSTARALCSHRGEERNTNPMVAHDVLSLLPGIGVLLEVHRALVACALFWDACETDDPVRTIQQRMCERQLARALVGLAGGPIAQIGRDALPMLFCERGVLGSRTYSQVRLKSKSGKLYFLD